MLGRHVTMRDGSVRDGGQQVAVSHEIEVEPLVPRAVEHDENPGADVADHVTVSEDGVADAAAAGKRTLRRFVVAAGQLALVVVAMTATLGRGLAEVLEEK